MDNDFFEICLNKNKQRTYPQILWISRIGIAKQAGNSEKNALKSVFCGELTFDL